MAYCIKCGAYIPDGQTVCLACGFDEEAEKRKAEAAKKNTGAAYQTQSDANAELRRKLEEQRRRSQEQNRQWAEQEKQRREEQAAREEARKEQQRENREWARQEYERRQAERQQTRSAWDEGQTAKQGNKALAAISYLSVLFAIPYIFTPEDEYAKFHAKQGLKLFLFGVAADILTSFIGFGWLATLARLYLIYKGMSNALNGIKAPLPWIGNLGEK